MRRLIRTPARKRLMAEAAERARLDYIVEITHVLDMLSKIQRKPRSNELPKDPLQFLKRDAAVLSRVKHPTYPLDHILVHFAHTEVPLVVKSAYVYTIRGKQVEVPGSEEFGKPRLTGATPDEYALCFLVHVNDDARMSRWIPCAYLMEPPEPLKIREFF